MIEKYEIKRQSTKKDFLLHSIYKPKTVPSNRYIFENKPDTQKIHTLSKSFENNFTSDEEIKYYSSIILFRDEGIFLEARGLIENTKMKLFTKPLLEDFNRENFK